jgi:hypothetical protein
MTIYEMILRPKWLCTKIQFIRSNNTSIIYHYYLCIKHTIFYFIFYIFFARNFGYSGNIVKCNDKKEYIVVHNDFQSTIILYREGVFKVLVCCTILYPFRSIMFVYDIDIFGKISNIKFEKKYVTSIESQCDIIEFRNILQLFNIVLLNLESLDDTFFINTISHIRDLHIHLLYLCEKPVLLIQRMFRKAISNPNYELCRTRLMKEYNIMNNDILNNKNTLI